MLTAIVFLLLVSTNCGRTVVNESIPKQPQPIVEGTPAPISPPNSENFDSADGVLVFNEFSEVIKANDGLVNLYGIDGTVWLTINYYKDGQIPNAEKNREFEPLSFRQSDFDLKFRCTGSSRNWFRVIAHEGNETTGYIRAGDGLFEFKPWRDFVLGFASVKFEREGNELRTRPNGARISNVPHDLRFVPVELDGDWLKIRANRTDVEGKNLQNGDDLSGWIRWRKGNKILVSDFYP